MGKEFLISCVGDSLTAGQMGYYGKTVPMSYQHWMKKVLGENNIQIVIKNLGAPGALTNQIINQIPAVKNPDILVLMGGTNDFWMFTSVLDDSQNNESINDVIGTLTTGVKRAKKLNIGIIVICSIPPVGNFDTDLLKMNENIVKTNQTIKQLADSFQIHFCDVWDAMRESNTNFAKSKLIQPDGVHFTLDGNQTCGETIGKTLVSIL
jgi:lysophospholipase L1-like esterase